MQVTKTDVHPGSEEELLFETPCGQVFLECNDAMMTPFGGFVPWSCFLKKMAVFESLSQSVPVTMTSPNSSSPYDILCSFMLTAISDGRRFSHINRLRHEPALKELFNLKRIVSDDTVRRFLHKIPLSDCGDWIADSTRTLWNALPDSFILDWDSTVQTRYGGQDAVAVGYNPQKPGRGSHHPLLAVVAGTRLCPYYRLRAGNVGSASGWVEAMQQAHQWMGKMPWLNRGDIGFCSEELLAWHEQQAEGPKCLFKLKLTKNVKRAIAGIPEESWQGCRTAGVLQTAEIKLKLTGWSNERRVVIGRCIQGDVLDAEQNEFWKSAKYEYEAYVTTLTQQEALSWQIIDLYRKRADCENVFDELKNQWGFNGFCSQHQEVTEAAARLLLVCYNLWNLFLRLIEPSRHIEAQHGRRWFLFMAARLVKTARQRIWKIAVSSTWWAELREGYQRVLLWCSLNAPQLE